MMSGYWSKRMQRIKAGKDPNGPVSEDELRLQEKWNAYIHTFVGKRICPPGQARGRSIKPRDDGGSVAAAVKGGLMAPPETLE